MLNAILLALKNGSQPQGLALPGQGGTQDIPAGPARPQFQAGTQDVPASGMMPLSKSITADPMDPNVEHARLQKDAAAAFHRYLEAQSKLKTLKAPKPRAPVSTRDLAPLGIAGAIALALGAKPRDLAEGLGGFMQGRQAWAGAQDQQAQQDLELQRSGMLGDAQSALQESQFLGGQADDAQRMAQYQQGRTDRTAQDLTNFNQQKELLGIQQDFKSKEAEKARAEKVNSQAFKARVKLWTDMLKPVIDSTDPAAKKRALDALDNGVATGQLDEDGRDAILTALSGDTFAHQKSTAQTKSTEAGTVLKEDTHKKNAIDIQYEKRLKELEVTNKGLDSENKRLQAQKMRVFIAEAPVKLADQLKRTAVYVSNINDLINKRVKGGSTLTEWKAENTPKVNLLVSEISELKKQAIQTQVALNNPEADEATKTALTAQLEDFNTQVKTKNDDLEKLLNTAVPNGFSGAKAKGDASVKTTSKSVNTKGKSLTAERAAAYEAIRRGKDPAAVRQRFKTHYHQDLD